MGLWAWDPEEMSEMETEIYKSYKTLGMSKVAWKWREKCVQPSIQPWATVTLKVLLEGASVKEKGEPQRWEEMHKLFMSRKGVIQEEGDRSQIELTEKVSEMIIEKVLCI